MPSRSLEVLCLDMGLVAAMAVAVFLGLTLSRIDNLGLGRGSSCRIERAWPSVLLFLLAALSIGRSAWAEAPAELERRLSIVERPLQVAGELLLMPSHLRSFYRARAYRPAWRDASHRTQISIAIERSAEHGLDPDHYHRQVLRSRSQVLDEVSLDLLASDAFLALAAHLASGRLDAAKLAPDWVPRRSHPDLPSLLEQALADGHVAGMLESLAPKEPDYWSLREALESERQRLSAGIRVAAIPPGSVIGRGDRDPRLPGIRQRLSAEGFAALPTGDPARFDSTLERQIRAFQRREGLSDDGRVGPLTLAALNADPAERIARLRVNLERRRWLAPASTDRWLRVIVPAFQLEALEGREVVRRHRVIVGRPDRPTPMISASVRYIVLNPWWEVPVRLAVEDELPLFRRDPGAVERFGFVVLDQQQRELDPRTIDWHRVPAETFPYRLRQRPGPLNALGKVKIIFPNAHCVYLHDTPAQSLFRKSRRDFSSGCVRLDQPFGLVAWLLGDPASWDGEALERLLAADEERRVDLDRPIEIRLLYLTAMTRADGRLRYLDDIYGLDQEVLDALDAPPLPESDG